MYGLSFLTFYLCDEKEITFSNNLLSTTAVRSFKFWKIRSLIFFF